MKDILLLYLNPIDWASIAAPPYGLEILAASIADLPVSVSIENPFLYADPNSYISSLLRTKKFDMIALSIRNLDNMAHVWRQGDDGDKNIDSRCFLDDILPVVETICKEYSGLIICGGAGFSIAPIELLNLFAIQYGICGPGEETFRILVERILDNENMDNYIKANYKHLPGMVYVKDTENKSISKLLQTNVKKRHPSYSSEWVGHTPVRISYGCNGQCMYCVERNAENGVQFRPLTDVIEEIEDVGKEGKSIWLACSEANMPNSNYITELCNMVVERGINNRFTSYFIPKNFTQAMYEKLICAGFTSHSICLGISHISNKVLAQNHIPYRREDIENTLDIFLNNKAAGVTIGLILGLDGEDEESFSELAEWIVQSSKKFGSGFRCFINSGVRIYPHTPLAKKIYSSDYLPKLYGQKPPFDLLRPLVYSSYKEPHIMLEEFLSMTKDAQGIVTAYNKGNTLMQDDKEVFIYYQKAMLYKSTKQFDLAANYLEKAYHKANLSENKRVMNVERMKIRKYLNNQKQNNLDQDTSIKTDYSKVENSTK